MKKPGLHKSALLLVADDGLRSLATERLRKLAYDVVAPTTVSELARALEDEIFLLGIIETRFCGKDALTLLGESSRPEGRSGGRWWVLCQDPRNEDFESLTSKGALHVSSPEQFANDFASTIQTIEQCARDPFYEVMTIIESVTGVQVKDHKRPLVETRLRRRMHLVGEETIEGYVQYFLRHRQVEL
ncbi:MAG: hypothetical protein EOP06_12750, partial [Proteobacteria bacterium]